MVQLDQPIIGRRCAANNRACLAGPATGAGPAPPLFLPRAGWFFPGGLLGWEPVRPLPTRRLAAAPTPQRTRAEAEPRAA